MRFLLLLIVAKNLLTVCVFISFNRRGFSWLKENNECNARDQASDVVLRKLLSVKYINRHVIDNHSRSLRASNYARVSVKFVDKFKCYGTYALVDPFIDRQPVNWLKLFTGCMMFLVQLQAKLITLDLCDLYFPFLNFSFRLGYHAEQA